MKACLSQNFKSCKLENTRLHMEKQDEKSTFTCSFITLCITYYFINTYKGLISVTKLPQVHIVTTDQYRTNQLKSSKNCIPYVKQSNFRSHLF